MAVSLSGHSLATEYSRIGFDDGEERQLGNEILVSDTGFGTVDVESFSTLDVLMAWQVEPMEVG